MAKCFELTVLHNDYQELFLQHHAANVFVVSGCKTNCLGYLLS